MLLNAPNAALIASTVAELPLDAVRTPATPAPPPNGRALLPVLEQQAQQELARLIAAQPAPTPAPTCDPAYAGLAWDLGLSGDEFDSVARTP
ncbi:hypothetical protein [Stenotrophomonas sp.]|uniref:hypothetical protein n=1 Tax=Stenotrophomonas sp. TaxID=69392 RepID=UPI0028963EA1|nr:hypothetical protein [Stenotrophomonas sp.]